MNQEKLNDTIRKYYAEQCDHPNGRGRSWDHCYGFFREHRGDLVDQQDTDVEDAAALHLGCYLASWGMYRGPFLREHAYTVHKPVVRVLASDRFSSLWQRDIGMRDEDDQAGTIMELVETVEAEYRKLTDQQKMDTLVTKVLLGTVGCLPARDSYFEKGFKHEGNTYGSLNRSFVRRVLDFCSEHRSKLTKLQPKIVDLRCRPYPLMKLVDMHFWQIGKGA